MSILQAIILGIIQGLTEFLPVSSSGHIELGKFLLQIETTEDLTFSLLVHGATVLSILIIFYKDILSLVKALFSFSWSEETAYILKLVLSMIPIGLVGFLWKDQLESFFAGNIVLVGVCLLLTAGLLLLTRLEKVPGSKVGFGQAFIIGLSQAVAVLPGISRSGATISTALALGVSRENAARFSFLMVLAPIMGANLLEMKDMAEQGFSSTLSPSVMLAGFLAAFLSGLLACNLMLRLVKQGKIIYFAAYCAIIGLIAITAGMMS